MDETWRKYDEDQNRKTNAAFDKVAQGKVLTQEEYSDLFNGFANSLGRIHDLETTAANATKALERAEWNYEQVVETRQREFALAESTPAAEGA